MVASLTKERPQANTNIFISLIDKIELIVKGAGVIHVIGFYEPEADDMDFGEEDLE